MGIEIKDSVADAWELQIGAAKFAQRSWLANQVNFPTTKTQP
jgi:hypothetical protein